MNSDHIIAESLENQSGYGRIDSSRESHDDSSSHHTLEGTVDTDDLFGRFGREIEDDSDVSCDEHRFCTSLYLSNPLSYDVKQSKNNPNNNIYYLYLLYSFCFRCSSWTAFENSSSI